MSHLRSVHTPTVRYGYITYFAFCLQRLGIPADRLAVPVGPAMEPQMLVPSRQLWELWESARTATGESGWGLRVAELQPRHPPGLIGEAIAGSSTLVEALTVHVYASSLFMGADPTLSLGIHGSGTFLELSSDYPEHMHPEGAEFVLACIVLSLLSTWNGLVFETHLRHRAPADPGLQHKVFGTEVRYDSERYGLSFDLGTALSPSPAGERDSTSGGHELIPTVSTQVGIVQQVDQVIADELNGRMPVSVPTIDGVAARLGLHPKNLNRLLAAHETTFRALLDAHRRRAALRLLDQPLSVQQIASRLGYSDTAAFVRAFRRWTEMSPGAYRNQTQGTSGNRSQGTAGNRSVAAVRS